MTANDVVSLFVGSGDVAGYLPRVLLHRTDKRKYQGGLVAWLLDQFRVIDGAAVYSRRRAGLQTFHVEHHVPKSPCQRDRRCIACPSAAAILKSDVNDTAQKRTCGQYHALRLDSHSESGHDTGNSFAFYQQIFDFLLKESQIFLLFKNLPNCQTVKRSVGLCPCCSYGWSFANVQSTKLNAAAVRCVRHQPAKCIDFPNNMAFSNAANGRVAGHLSNCF